MAIITRLFSRGTDDVVVRRAPSNKMYLVEAMNVVLLDFASNTLYVLNRHMKVGVSQIIGKIDTNTTPSLIAIFRQSAIASHHSFWVGDINERTKYLSVGFENANTMSFAVIVYGKIINASKSDLVWEFIKKRHR